MNSANAECWRSIFGYEGLYEISDFGRVRSFDRVILRSNGISEMRPGRIMRSALAGRGYPFVKLFKDGKGKAFYIHRLVAAAFLPFVEGMHVNHIDFDKTNNRASNLEWVTPKQNTAHSIDAGRWSGKYNSGKCLAANNPNRAQKLTLKDVRDIRAACANGVKQSITAEKFGITQGTVSAIKRGSVWRVDVLAA